MKWLDELNLKHNKYKSIDFKNKFKNKLDISELNKIFKSIGENINVWEINSLITKSPNENKKIIILNYILLSNKMNHYKTVSNFFLKIFNREQPIILICTYKNNYSISFNAFSLKNSIIKEILKKYNYIGEFFDENNFNRVLPWKEISLNSIIDFFDESCRRIIYYEKTKNLSFSYTITWEVIKILFLISNKEKEIIQLNNKYKKIYNESEKYNIHKNIKSIEEEIKKLKDKLSKFIS